ncbi:hypothetical protein [Alkalibacillus almallahensis]|uniref:hypothetical protein n=1 Tax=Alkalibacillus almallahensis TaxID=1379154 RepID=UPI001421C963|nr:hypothetical protein [Alkalibacillus almallahensis]NIK11453.1 uncharacterized protein YycO [Alkalibacillus almallahensis]
MSEFHPYSELQLDGELLNEAELYLNNQYMTTVNPQNTRDPSSIHDLTIVTKAKDGSRQTLSLPVTTRRPNDFRPGDILVASDNFGDVYPPGYIGHSAIVVDDRHIIESVTSHPQVRKSPANNFLSVHTQVMHARPKDPEVGEAAAAYAKEYLNAYTTNLNNGESVPEFSFTTQVPLNDPNEAIYCSKLVWLSYYYGADIEFDNNFFLFAPVDLEANLEDDDRFEVLYKHPDFDFKINLKL